MLSDGDLLRAMKKCAQIGAIAQVHAENGDVIEEVVYASVVGMNFFSGLRT